MAAIGPGPAGTGAGGDADCRSALRGRGSDVIKVVLVVELDGGSPKIRGDVAHPRWKRWQNVANVGPVDEIDGTEG